MISHAYVINLDKRPERLARFWAELPLDWPFPKPVRSPGIDGTVITPPAWWPVQPSAYGCYLAHLMVLERAIADNADAALVLEDDAVFLPSFSALWGLFSESLPADWQMLYLGGQLLKTNRVVPARINQHVLKPFNVNRLHAYVYKREIMPLLQSHLSDAVNWRKHHHIDHQIALLHETGAVKVYCPARWMVGQAGGVSDIKGGAPRLPQRFWPSPAKAAGDWTAK